MTRPQGSSVGCNTGCGRRHGSDQCGPGGPGHLPTRPQMLLCHTVLATTILWLLSHAGRDLGRVSDGRLPGFESNRDVTLGSFLNLAKPPLACL